MLEVRIDIYLSINNLAIPQSPYLFIGMRACTLNQLHSCLTLHNSVDCSLSGSSVHGIFQARIPEWLPCPPSGDLPDPGIEPRSLMAPALASRLFTTSATWEAHLLASDQIRSVAQSCPTLCLWVANCFSTIYWENYFPLWVTLLILLQISWPPLLGSISGCASVSLVSNSTFAPIPQSWSL